ncbi:MAG TPA: histidine kinase [Kofleriaceae bacterium]|nr:histidine kinase [Kofleriaceae bacterium]
MSRARMTGLLVAIWSAPAALMIVQSLMFDGGLGESLVRDGAPWVVWVAVTPRVLARADAGALRGRRLVGHIARALAIAALFGAITGALTYAVRPVHKLTFAGEIAMAITDWVPMQALVYAGVLATGMALDAARRRRAAELGRAQLETQLAYAQLAALRAQLQPHFLFNTLNAAVALARDGDAGGTARVLVLLGDLLRQLLRADAPQEIPLREELDLLATYLEIQRVRLGDRLRVEWAIADDVRDALVPQLVLQPLVENALQHGIARRTRAGQLAIRAARDGDRLRLQVSDDGPGVAAGFSLAAATGVGLRNTRDRLHRLYGERGALALATRGALTTAAIELPMREAGHG